MRPPSDSLRHQELKLAEALPNIQAIEVPPPSYTLTPVTTTDSFHNYTTNDDDDEEYCLAPLAPITVHVDASTRIDGQANTVILPPIPTANSTVSGPAGLDRTAQAGHARAKRLTSAVLIALRDAGVVDGGGGGGYHADRRAQRPLEVSVNASLSVTGDKNVICAGTSRARRKDGIASAPASGVQGSTKSLEDTEVSKEGSQKRRAESVSLTESLDGRTDLGKIGFYSLLVDDGGGDDDDGDDGDDGDDADLRWQSGTGRDTEDKAFIHNFTASQP